MNLKNKIILILFGSLLSMKIDAQNASSTDTITFKVYFLTTSEKLDLKQDKLKNVPEISFEALSTINDTLKKVFRYTSGNFIKLNDAKVRKKFLIESGFTDCFILAFKNGKRIFLDEIK